MGSDCDFNEFVQCTKRYSESSQGRIQDLILRGGGEIRQGDRRVLLLLSQMFVERMVKEN